MTVLLIDGRSGSGKTRLAAALGLPVLHMDDLYPGWEGLAAGSKALPDVLDARRYRRWDWAAGGWAEWHELPESFVVEGVGSISRASRERADAAVWLELDATNRKRRALDRDGDTFAPHWDEWAGQEDDLAAREHGRDLADLVLDGRLAFDELVKRVRAALA